MQEDQFDETASSKTQLKKLATELQDLGEKLTTLKSADLDLLPLSNQLRSAVAEFKRLPNSHGARRRQLQFIGKLMRESNKEKIENAIFQLNSSTNKKNQTDQLILELAEKIIAKGDTTINELVACHSNLERQKLRQLYLEIHKASEKDRKRLEKTLQNYLQSNRLLIPGLVKPPK